MPSPSPQAGEVWGDGEFYYEVVNVGEVVDLFNIVSGGYEGVSLFLWPAWSKGLHLLAIPEEINQPRDAREG